MKRTSGKTPKSEFYQSIVEEVAKLPGIQSSPYQLEPWGTEFTIAGKHVGNIHNIGVADILFPQTAINYLIENKIAKFHLRSPYLAIMFPIKTEIDLEKTIWLFKESYTLQVLALKNEGHVNAIPGNLNLSSLISELQQEDASMKIILDIFKDEPNLEKDVIEWGYIT